jgi:hypothetical protein
VSVNNALLGRMSLLRESICPMDCCGARWPKATLERLAYRINCCHGAVNFRMIATASAQLSEAKGEFPGRGGHNGNPKRTTAVLQFLRRWTFKALRSQGRDRGRHEFAGRGGRRERHRERGLRTVCGCEKQR